MYNWLRKIRNKPKRVKDQYAFAGAMFFTSIIAFFWVLSLSAPPTQDVANSSAPFVETKSAFGQFFTRAKEQLGSVLASKDVLTATTTATTTPSAPEVRPNVVIPQLSTSTLPRFGTPILISTTTSSSTFGD